jgi:predicted RNase H-like HicB family nuclease
VKLRVDAQTLLTGPQAGPCYTTGVWSGRRTCPPTRFRIVVEPDEDRWRAYFPELEAQGASTWGYTKERALQHIREVLEMIVESERAEPLHCNAMLI